MHYCGNIYIGIIYMMYTELFSIFFYQILCQAQFAIVINGLRYQTNVIKFCLILKKIFYFPRSQYPLSTTTNKNLHSMEIIDHCLKLRNGFHIFSNMSIYDSRKHGSYSLYLFYSQASCIRECAFVLNNSIKNLTEIIKQYDFLFHFCLHSTRDCSA